MGPGFSYGPDDWFRSRMGWGLSPFTAGTEAEYQLPHYAAVDISRREKGETSWREASCFDSEKPFIMETKYQVPHNAAPDILHCGFDA